MKWAKAVVILGLIAMVGFLVIGVKITADKAYERGYVDGFTVNDPVLNPPLYPDLTDTLPLEDRFANLMEALSDNGTMKYQTVIRANLSEDGDPDTVEITLYLAEGESITK